MSNYMEEIKIIVVVGESANLRNICRICLSRSGSFQSVFIRVETTDGNINLAEMIMEYSSVQITLGDGLPENMCITCAQKCIELYKFKRKCETSDATLRRLYGININVKSEALLWECAVNGITEQIVPSDFVVASKKAETLTADVILNDSISQKLSINKIKLHQCDNNNRKRFPKKLICSKQLAAFASKKCLIPLHLNLSEDSKAEITESMPPTRQHECSICKKRFRLISNLYKHAKAHSPLRSHICNICKKAFATLNRLNVHIKFHDGNKPHVCNICSKAFFSISGVQSHMLIHTGEKPFLCTTCGKSFNHASNLRQHVELHSDVKRHICKECGTAFNSPGKLAFHMKKHTGLPFLCTTCGRGFASSSNLRSHMHRHTGIKGHICTECGSAFTSKGELTVHLRKHTGEKPYVCPICGRAFARSDPLTLHMRIHTGEKPYECDVCQKKFARSYQRGYHKKHNHSLERQCDCKFCGKSFSKPIYLGKHLQTHAGEKLEDCKQQPKVSEADEVFEAEKLKSQKVQKTSKSQTDRNIKSHK